VEPVKGAGEDVQGEDNFGNGYGRDETSDYDEKEAGTAQR
jgi:hypothetical protein